MEVDLQPGRNNTTITMGASSMRHRKEPGLATSGRQGFRDSLNLRIERKGPQICSDQSVPWVPEQLWPPSAYSNRVSWKEQEAQANSANEAGRGAKPSARLLTAQSKQSESKAHGRVRQFLLSPDLKIKMCPDILNYQQKPCLAEQCEIKYSYQASQGRPGPKSVDCTWNEVLNCGKQCFY